MIKLSHLNKFYFLFFFISYFLTGCGTVSPRFTIENKKKSEVKNNFIEKKKVESNIPEQKMMDVVLKYLGTPYKFGGNSFQGIDCSAFTKEVYKQSVGKDIPRTTIEQFKIGKIVNSDDLIFGDLIFFNTDEKKNSHVGIYIGDNLFAHASENAGVTITSFDNSYYKKRFSAAKRIMD